MTTNNLKPIETVYKGYRWNGVTPTTPKKKISQRADLTGQRFGRLVVIEDLGVIDRFYHLWGCVCDCGNRKAIRSRELLRGHTQSCGCLQSESRKTFGGHAGSNALTKGESAFNQFFFGYKKSARERGYTFELSKDEFRDLTNQPCHYCGTESELKFQGTKGTNGSYYGNGIDRIDNTIGYVTGNVRPCCKQCNIAKGTLTEQEFLSWIMRIAARFEHGEKGAR